MKIAKPGTFVLLFALLFTAISAGQSKVSTSGNVKIFSLLDEYIDGECKTVTSTIDLSQKTIAVSVSVKGFKFEKAVMQKKFNNEENMNTAVYPKAKFVGKIISEKGLETVGAHKVEIDGEMTIKGVTNKVKTNAIIVVNKDDTVGLDTEFMLNGLDYDLTLKYVKEMRITVDLSY